MSWDPTKVLSAMLAAVVVGGLTTLLLMVGGGLVGWWPANGSPRDVEGSHPGTAYGDVAYAPGMVGLAFSLDGDGDYIEVLNHPDLNPSSFSLASWIKTERAFAPIMSKQACGGQRYRLNVDSGKAAVGFTASDGSGDVATVGSSVINDGTWHHVAGVFDDRGNSLKVYVDGSLEASTDTTGTPPTSVAPLQVGRQDGTAAGYFEGYIDEVRIDDRSYSDDEVAALYALRDDVTDSSGTIAISSAGAGGSVATYVRQALEVSSFSGSVFSAPVSTYPGSSYDLDIVLANASSIDVRRRLVVSAHPCFSFSNATPTGDGYNVKAFQLSGGSFRVHVSPLATGDPSTDTLRLKVRVGTGVVPGFYRVRFTMEPYATGR